jgi:hypothetical protein
MPYGIYELPPRRDFEGKQKNADRLAEQIEDAEAPFWWHVRDAVTTNEEEASPTGEALGIERAVQWAKVRTAANRPVPNAQGDARPAPNWEPPS